MCYSLTDAREKALLRWLSADLGLQIETIQPASSDASFRRYYRVSHQNGCHIVMDAPPEKENTANFVRNAKYLKAAGLHVPTVYQQDLEQGFLLLEDLGSRCYLEALQAGNADALYGAALDSLYRLQCHDMPAGDCLPAYDNALLRRELDIFYEWFLEKRLGILIPIAIRDGLNDSLVDAALGQPQVCVHRDYHSRNLMLLADDSPPGILDFQDAVIGPITYDLVSLLRDCYIGWPEDRIEHWLSAYYRRVLQAGLVQCGFDRFRTWFDWMGLQRHLKAIGIFSRLHLRDNKSGYLADIPRTMDYISLVSGRYAEFAAFDDFLRQQVLPVYRSEL